MKLLVCSLFSVILASSLSAARAQSSRKAMLVIHGGAGTILKKNMTAELEKEYRDVLDHALRKGHQVLKKGGSSLDAVEAAIHVMEDSPLFNAGKGAVFTHDGRNELDASIMEGKTLRAGSVAGLTVIKNPISAARAVMEKSPHVMMSGRGADLFATRAGLEVVDPSYFWTERRWEQLQRELVKEEEEAKKDKDQGVMFPTTLSEDDFKFGTVGAVAVDDQGTLAAGTSTGGMTNKRYGRVGDSPIIGAGTYADNASCAVSATGHGEFFIRWAVAHDIAALVKYKGLSVEQAASQVIYEKLLPVKGEGGVIALDTKGNFSMPFNTEGMYRGFIGSDGVAHVAIYKDDDPDPR